MARPTIRSDRMVFVMPNTDGSYPRREDVTHHSDYIVVIRGAQNPFELDLGYDSEVDWWVR